MVAVGAVVAGGRVVVVVAGPGQRVAADGREADQVWLRPHRQASTRVGAGLVDPPPTGENRYPGKYCQ